MSTPTYDALVAEGFDPATVPPTQTYAERNLEHDLWFEATVARVAARKLPVRKAAKR